MQIIIRTFQFFQMAVIAVIVVVVVLMILRLITDALDLNPFGWPSRTSRRLTDVFIGRTRRFLMGLGVDPKFAPLAVILITILMGWFFLWLSRDVASTVAGLLISIKGANPISAMGCIIYGALSVYVVFIFMRIVFSWGMVGNSNRLMRFLVNVTEPLLGPLRRMIPPLGMMDISPIFAFLIIWLFQLAIRETLLAGGLPAIG